MRILVAVLIGVVLGAGLTALTSRAECCAQFDRSFNAQLEQERQETWDRIEQQALPLPHYTVPSLPCAR